MGRNKKTDFFKTEIGGKLVRLLKLLETELKRHLLLLPAWVRRGRLCETIKETIQETSVQFNIMKRVTSVPFTSAVLFNTVTHEENKGLSLNSFY